MIESISPMELTAKVTHIVGDGQSNKSQQAFFQGNPLPFLYKNFPNVAFPGIYNQSWDNATWPVTNFVHGGAAGFDTSVTTSVSANGAGSGCVDWGAIIFSTLSSGHGRRWPPRYVGGQPGVHRCDKRSEWPAQSVCGSAGRKQIGKRHLRGSRLSQQSGWLSWRL